MRGFLVLRPVYLVRDVDGLPSVDARRVEYAVIDVETTGLDASRGQRVCEPV
jgi:DNA polymerase III epsilon subunit-like protein